MSNQEHDPINEAHASLDQLSRVAISAVLQMAELKARREAHRARRERDEQVALAKAMGAQLEAGYAAAPGDRPMLAGPGTDGPGPAWQAANDERWWGSATGDDLGRAWATASAEAAAGDPSAGEALAELRRQVEERWGLAIDQDGTVVDVGGSQEGPTVDGGLSVLPVGHGAPDGVGARHRHRSGCQDQCRPGRGPRHDRGPDLGCPPARS